MRKIFFSMICAGTRFLFHVFIEGARNMQALLWTLTKEVLQSSRLFVEEKHREPYLITTDITVW
jgi:hypothetical protein